MFAKLAQLPTGLQHAAIYAAALGLSKIASVAMLPVFTHFLTPEEYGKLDILQTLANLLSIVIGFGLADTLFRFAGAAQSDEEKRETAAGIFGLAVMATVLTMTLTQVAAPWITDLMPGDMETTPVRFILFSLSLTGLILVPLAWMRMSGRPVPYFAGTAGRAIAQAVLIAAALGLGFGIEGVLFAGMVCACVLAAVLSLHQLRETGIRFSLVQLTTQGRFGGTLVVAGVATFVLDSCDRWFLAGAVGPTALADYALAGKIGIMAAFVTQPFELWWLPKRFSVLTCETGAERCARTTELGLCLYMVAALGIAGMGAAVIYQMTPEAYHGAIPFIPALAGLAALNAATTLINTGVLSETRTSKPIWIDGSAAAIAATGYVALIPALGGWGAIYATVLALTFRFLAYLQAGQSKRFIPYRLSAMMLPAMIAVSGIVATSVLADPVYNILAGAAFSILVLASGLVLKLIPLPGGMRPRAAFA